VQSQRLLLWQGLLRDNAYQRDYLLGNQSGCHTTGS
jgi:hypothetical protein